MDKFIVKTPPSIEGETNYEGINKMMQLLYNNAANITKTQRGGYNGNIGNIMKPTLYTTLTTTAWTNLPNPGVYPTITRNDTTSLQEHILLQHYKGRRIYDNTVSMDEDLKN